MLEIECLNCQKVLDIPKWVDIKSYDGEIVCKECGARLAIKFVDSPKPAKYKVVEKPTEKENPVTVILKPAKERGVKPKTMRGG